MYRDKISRDKTFIVIKLLLSSFILTAVMACTVTAANSAGKPIQSFKFEEDFSIRKALAMLGSAYDKNIVPTPQVDGQLAFRGLSDVTFEEAMDAILGDDFKYEKAGNLIKVYTKDEYNQLMSDPERMVYKVFTLYYITAAEAQKLITPLLSANAKIEVTSPAEKTITAGAGGSSGGAGGSSGGSASSGLGASKGGGDDLAMNDTLVIYDYPENIEAVQGLLDVIDIRPKQVLVEATILSALLTEGMELGVDWNLAAGVDLTGVGGIKVPDDLSKGTPLEIDGFAGTTSGNGLKLGITTGDVRVFVTALESITDTTVLATPKVMTVNKQEGSVLIGTNLGYRSSTTISTGGVATEGEVKFLQTGTQLVFRPYIGGDGYIRMEIYPKDSSASLNADGVPTENTVEMKSNIIVKDGETIVIGGLFRNVVTTTRNQIPILGDLPWVGAAFRGTSDSNQREEVIVLLTTHIIEHPSELADKPAIEDVRRRSEGAKDAMQSISRTKMAETAYEKAAKFYVEGNIAQARQQLKVALKLRPAYTEAIRLKEKIDAENPPATAANDEELIEYESAVTDEGMVKNEGVVEEEGAVIESAESKGQTWSKK